MILFNGFGVAALNEALAAEVQRLKLTAAEFSGEVHLSNCMAQQLSIDHQMLQLQPQQQQQRNVYQMQQQHQQPQQGHHNQSQTQQQNGDASAANESK